jgi:hypothetical protein
MASESPIFRYHELDHESRAFRLLRLLPSTDFDAEIHCELFESSIDNRPSYDAVSYVWGDANITVLIRLHDTTRSVTTNLGLALRYLRLAEEQRILWVDALCINQENNLEKNHQVRQMGSIYASAQQVIVWLGEEEDARHAYQSLDEFIAQSEKIPREASRIIWNSADFAAAKIAWESLFARPWWTRMWTLQEVIHDRPVTAYAGSFQINFDDLCRNLLIYKVYSREEALLPSIAQSPDIPSTIPSRYSRFHDAMVMAILNHESTALIHFGRNLRKSAPEKKFGLARRLYSIRNQQCSDPRDKVYALLGMNGNKEYEQLIDYELSMEETNAATMTSLLTSGTGLNSLLHVECPERLITAEGLPSWVSDWSTQQGIVAKTMSLISPGFRTCKGSNYMHEYNNKRMSISNGTLTIPGIYIGLITHVSVVELNLEAKSLDYRSLKLFKYNQDPSRDLCAWASEEDTTSPMDMYNSSWGPHWAERGDVIIVSLLCTIPWVLRRDGDAYLFVGGCWLIDSELQGGVGSDQFDIKDDPGFSTIMHGSAWDETKIEEFRIN